MYGTADRTGQTALAAQSFQLGLTAESVITVLESQADYKRFENTLMHDHAPETALECALVARLASLLWRLRRSVAIESGLFQIQAEILRDRKFIDVHDDPTDPLKVFYDLLKHPHTLQGPANESGNQTETSHRRSARNNDLVDLAVCFLRLENFNPGKLALVGRYETRLWRQLVQTILVLHSMTGTGLSGPKRNRYSTKWSAFRSSTAGEVKIRSKDQWK